MAYDYSHLIANYKSDESNSWRQFWDDELPVGQSLQALIKHFILLPQDFYDIVAAYLLMPSALCQTVPYLFFFGASGSGKSTLGKIASKWYGVKVSTSGVTYAGLRNLVSERRCKQIVIKPGDAENLPLYKEVEINTAVVWDDIDVKTFLDNPNFYRLFKFGYDRETDLISISSETKGKNLDFRCFCPKIFSSISPLHQDERLKELKRRLLPIHFSLAEDLNEKRLTELGLTKNNWQLFLKDFNAYSWQGFNQVFVDFWDKDVAEAFLIAKQTLAKNTIRLSSYQKIISLDLLAAGIVSEVWKDEVVAISKLKAYFSWLKKQDEQASGLKQLLKEFIATEAKNFASKNSKISISSRELRSQINVWANQDWILDKPKTTELKAIMADLGFYLYQGCWKKR